MDESKVVRALAEAFIVFILYMLALYLGTEVYISLPLGLWALFKGLQTMKQVHYFFKQLDEKDTNGQN